MKDKKRTNSIWKKVLVFLLISAIILPSVPVPNGIMAGSYEPEDMDTFSDGAAEGGSWIDEHNENESSDRTDTDNSDTSENPADATTPDVEFSDESSAEETDTTPPQDSFEETDADDTQGENGTDFTDGENSETNPPADDNFETEEETSGPESLVYEDSSIRLTASCCDEGAIPRGTVLQVEAIEKENSSTALAYQGAEEKLREKALNQGYELQGFLAYDIAFVDEQGNRQQPNGSVRLTLEYKTYAAPSTVSQPETCIISAAEVSQDDFGQVTQVTELTSGEITALETTPNGEVQKLEYVKNRLSALAVVWNGEAGTEPDAEEEITPTPTPDAEEEITPTPTPDGEEEITPTPTPDAEEEITPTPTPDAEEEITPTPTPDAEEELTPTPTPEPQTLEYEDDNLKAVLTPSDWEASEGVSLRVTALADEDETASRMYEQIAAKLAEESEEGENPISGFLSYNIALEDEQGNVIQPEGEALVNIQYKEAALPEALKEAEITDREVSLWEVEQDENGQPIQTVNLQENGRLSNLSTTEEQGIAEVEFSAERLTTYAAVWADSQEQKEPEASEYLEYEDDSVKVVVSAVEEGAIPEGSTLKVVPVLPEDEETAEKYTETEARIQEKAESDEFQVIGFLAYDITFVDEDGNKAEPNGQVQVSMEYKEAAVPEAVKGEAAETAEVTVLHLEEDENGEVTQVVDMGKSNQLTNVETTETKEVQKAEFVTESFSVFTIIWQYGYSIYNKVEIKLNYVYTDGQPVTGMSGKIEVPSSTNKITLSDYEKEIQGCKHVITTTDSYWNTQVLNYLTTSGGGLLKNGTQGWSAREYNVYIVYEKDEEPDTPDIPTPPDYSLGEPEHSKQIRKEVSGEYTLSLDVKAKQGNPKPIDILLIVDKSASMKKDSRFSTVSGAVNNLIVALKNSDTDINLAAVTFSSAVSNGSYMVENKNGYEAMVYSATPTSYYKGDTAIDAWSYTNGWKSLDEFSFKMGLTDCDGGTNWQAGIRLGEELLSLRSKQDTEKYVIFLTDGNPTFRYLNGSNTITQGMGKDIDTDEYVDPNEVKNNIKTCYESAVAEWGKSKNLSASTTIKYLVDANTTEVDNRCTEFSGIMGATLLAGKNEVEIINSFEEIADNILKPAYSNVHIEDTLSDYVNFASENTSKDVRVYMKSGETASEVPLDTKEYNLTIDERKIKVELNKGALLPDATEYRIEFKVKPSLKAYYEYSKNGGYKETTGDEDTDLSGNHTSSLQPGFHSNTNAVVVYSVNGKNPTTAPYKHPVIQVDLETVSKTVHKVWEGPPLEEVMVELKAMAEVKGEIKTLTRELLGLLPEKMDYTLNETNEWTYTWSQLPKFYYYEDNNGEIQKAEIIYTVDEPEVPDGYTKKITEAEDTFTITNTSNQGLRVTKIWTDEASDGSSHKSDVVYVGLYEVTKDNKEIPVQNVKPLEIKFNEDTDSAWTGLFQQVDSGKTYVVRELIMSTEGEFDIGRVRYTGVADGAFYKSGGKDYKVSYSGNQEEGFLIRNERLNSITIRKVDKNSGHPLAGARFKLEKQTENGWIPVNNPDSSNDEYQIETENDGTAIFEKLEDCTYRITEIQSPAGYSLLLNPIEVTLPYVKNGGEGNGDIQMDKGVVKEDGTYYYDVTYTINNNKVFDMPEGGGTGTQGIVFAGIFMMLAAGGYGLILRKRRQQTIRR